MAEADDGDGGTVAVRREDEVLRVVLERPERGNALSPGMVRAFAAAFEEAASDDGLRAILIEGAGRDFCTGVDWVSSNEEGGRPRTGHLVRRTPLRAHRIVQLLHDVHLPVVCAVQGWAAGFGMGLALAADFTVATRSALLWAPFTRRGFTPDSGSTWLLPRLVGMARAKELLLLGRRITGAEAAEMGLIHRAVEPDELPSAAAALVGELANGPTVALGLAKAALHGAANRTLADALTDETMRLELACRTLDFKEGLAAFAERRDPGFRGR
ncbi:enoyl-CoA hydratase/isomerase family protein [Actinocorallia libanotica]|uniref:Enoyl-CoA hydratase-related protein n=1 Tax=Actinocorallia libanotica TaxID=46162 RepID=A0ABP4C6A0_9ACTN